MNYLLCEGEAKLFSQIEVRSGFISEIFLDRYPLLDLTFPAVSHTLSRPLWLSMMRYKNDDAKKRRALVSYNPPFWGMPTKGCYGLCESFISSLGDCYKWWWI